MSKEVDLSGVTRDNHCFVCGKDNPQGLHLSFRHPEPGRAESDCLIPEHFSGWEHLTHGGILAMLLDEVMAYACLSREGNSVTAEITVRFLKPVEVGQRVRLTGRVVETRRRVVNTEGEILGPDGQVVARGQARFLLV
jgi:uncharacterized protein (TIGR00369 family)